MPIFLKNIRSYAYHGCLAEEARIGGNYRVDVRLDFDSGKSERTDDLKDTVDYCQVYDIVQREMDIRSKLIEHVGARIADALLKEIALLDATTVRVTKIAPPMNGDVQEVQFIVRRSRSGK